MNKNLFIVTFATILILAMAITGCANSTLTPAPTQEGLTVCESGGGYLNPDNPDEYTSGVYPDDFGVCPENYGCLVDIPATGVCVPIYPTKGSVAAITRAVTFTATATPEVEPVLPVPTQEQIVCVDWVSAGCVGWDTNGACNMHNYLCTQKTPSPGTTGNWSMFCPSGYYASSLGCRKISQP